jgi:DNA-binding NarL/FixJ family response regulator
MQNCLSIRSGCKAGALMRIVIIDDSILIRERLSQMLSELEEIEIVAEEQDEIEAIECIRKLKPDVVILDIRLRKGSGINVMREIKKDKPSPAVIILTSYPNNFYRMKCLSAGAEFFLDKSTEFEKIPVILKEMASSLSDNQQREA